MVPNDTLVRSNATRCRYESGESYPASWPSICSRPTRHVGIIKWMSASKWQEQFKPGLGLALVPAMPGGMIELYCT